MPSPLSIAIIGGGPGGLSLARLLQLKGFSATVYERDASRQARVQGGSLDLRAKTGRRTMRDAGLEAGFNAVARRNGQRAILLRKDGSTAIDLPYLKLLNFAPEIDRGDLRALLLDSLQPDSVKWDRRFEAIDRLENGRLRMRFSNAAPVEADLIVGADGVRSKVRPHVTDIALIPAGCLAIEGQIIEPATRTPELHRLVDNGTFMGFGDGRAIIVQAQTKAALLVLVVLRAPENWAEEAGIDLSDRKAFLAHFDREFANWHPMFREPVHATSGEFILRPLYRTDYAKRWQSRPNMTLLGDAAHAMPFFAGEGANQAMADAWQLAECLAQPGITPAAAIASYEDEMWERTARAAQTTAENESMFFAPDAPDNYLKKMMGPLRGIAPAVPHIVRSINRVTGWFGA